MRNKSLFVGTSAIAASVALVGVIGYEPANLVAALGVQDLLSEASVVALGLLTAVALAVIGGAALRRPAPR